MGERIVIALGGNALGNTPQEQLRLVRSTAKPIVDLVEKGARVVICHGNGPQAGMINLAMEFSSQNGGDTPYMPLAECGAMTQGYIGYHLQQAIQRELNSRGIHKECAALVTQVVVDRNDPGFDTPTKPVGSFYSKEEAERIAEKEGFTFVEDAGRGYRRVVPSPLPRRIVELETIRHMALDGVIVIAAGGGGIPVVETPDGMEGVAAVIDKDRAASLLARELHADRLVILTTVDRVCIRYGKPDQTALAEMTLEDCERYIGQGEFAPGSMLPKVEACMDFVRNSDCGATALITSLSRAADALEGKTGTLIKK